MPWIKSGATNPGAGQTIIRFRVFTGNTPHSGLVGVIGVLVSSTATVSIVFRRKNAAETQTYDNLLRIVCPANDTRFIRSPDDPFIPIIGVPEAGSYEICEAYIPSAITGTVFVAVEVAGGPVDVLIGGVA
jgi:hypothetical protein